MSAAEEAVVLLLATPAVALAAAAVIWCFRCNPHFGYGC